MDGKGLKRSVKKGRKDDCCRDREMDGKRLTKSAKKEGIKLAVAVIRKSMEILFLIYPTAIFPPPF